MGLTITPAAIEVLERAQSAAGRINPNARVRVFKAGERIEVGLAEEAEEGDEVIEQEGIVIYVAPGVTGTLGVSEEHDRLEVSPD